MTTELRKAAHILAVNREIARLMGLEECPYDMSIYGATHGQEKAVWARESPNHSNRYYNWMERWHDAGPLMEEMGILTITKWETYYEVCTWRELSVRSKGEIITHAICYAYLRSRGVENPERLGVE